MKLSSTCHFVPRYNPRNISNSNSLIIVLVNLAALNRCVKAICIKQYSVHNQSGFSFAHLQVNAIHKKIGWCQYSRSTITFKWGAVTLTWRRDGSKYAAGHEWEIFSLLDTYFFGGGLYIHILRSAKHYCLVVGLLDTSLVSLRIHWIALLTPDTGRKRVKWWWWGFISSTTSPFG